jgi:hypothetical protein
MSRCKRRHVSPDEQHVLEHGYLLLLNSAKDIAQCDQAIRQHHYLRGVTLVGEHIRYAFVYRGRSDQPLHDLNFTGKMLTTVW